MEPKVALVVLIVIVVVVIVVMMAGWKAQASSDCAKDELAANKRNISGLKTWLSPQPKVGAVEASMNHTESDRLRSPLFPMRQILDQLVLTRDHCAYRRRCYECLAKHMLMMEAWADFGGLLAGTSTDDYGKIAQSVSEKLTEVRRLGVVKSRMANWAKELYDKIREAYPNLDLEYAQLDDVEIDEIKTPLLPLRLPHFNLREIWKLLQLMETTTAHPELRCVECLRYHLANAIALAREGSEMSPVLRGEYEDLRRRLEAQLAQATREGIAEDTSQWFRAERKRLNESYPELHEQGLYKSYDPPVYLAKCGETCG